MVRTDSLTSVFCHTCTLPPPPTHTYFGSESGAARAGPPPPSPPARSCSRSRRFCPPSATRRAGAGVARGLALREGLQALGATVQCKTHD